MHSFSRLVKCTLLVLLVAFIQNEQEHAYTTNYEYYTN